jgi:hypothetical protein
MRNLYAASLEDIEKRNTEEWDRAWTRVSFTGVVSEADAKTLGIPAGTMSFENSRVIMEDAEKRYRSFALQFANAPGGYMKEINRLIAEDPDGSNPYTQMKIGVLHELRYGKIETQTTKDFDAGMEYWAKYGKMDNPAFSKATGIPMNATTMEYNSVVWNKAFSIYQIQGIASPKWVFKTLGIPKGSKTLDYKKYEQDFLLSRMAMRNTGGGSGGSKEKEKGYTKDETRELIYEWLHNQGFPEVGADKIRAAMTRDGEIALIQRFTNTDAPEAYVSEILENITGKPVDVLKGQWNASQYNNIASTMTATQAANALKDFRKTSTAKLKTWFGDYYDSSTAQYWTNQIVATLTGAINGVEIANPFLHKYN